MSFRTHLFFSLLIFATVIFGLGLNALGQSSQPVVAPWSVDNTDGQSRIRQYQNFRQLQAEPPAQIAAKANGRYEYEPQPQNDARTRSQRSYNPLSQAYPQPTPEPARFDNRRSA